MLFLLNRPDQDALGEATQLTGDADKELLLISDGVYLASKAGWTDLQAMGFDEIYAESQAVTVRGLKLEDGCQMVDMDEIVDIIVDNAKVLNV